MFTAVLLLFSGQSASADTLSTNISSTTAGTETAAGDTWLTASFGTSSSSSLEAVTLLLSNPSSGVAELDLFSNGLLAPGTLVGTLTSPATYSTALSAATFSSNGLTLSANSTYWIVLKALSGEFDWAWTTDTSGSGTAFQGTWGISSDAGSDWYTYTVYPTQFSISASDVATPEPRSSLLFFAGVLLLSSLIFYRLQRGQHF